MPTPEETAAAAAAAASKPWHEGLDADTTGYFQNRGLLDKDAKTVIIETSKAHRNAERALGVPADRLVRLPADKNDKAGWGEVWSKLGRPAEAKDYTITASGDKDATFVPALQAKLFELNAPKEVGEGVGTFLNDFFKKHFDTQKAAAEARVQVEKTELEQSWGANAKANEVIVDKAAAALKITPQELAAGLGFKRTMELLHTIGSKIGEDKFIRPDEQGQRITTREQAISRIKDLKADKGFVQRYQAGDVDAKTQMNDLHTIAYG